MNNKKQIRITTLLISLGLTSAGCDNEEPGGSNDSQSKTASKQTEDSSPDNETTNSDQSTSETDSNTEPDPSADTDQDEGEIGSESSDGSEEAVYPEGPYGKGIGSVIENLTFVDERGEPVQLQDFYATKQRALILYGTTAWCSSCVPKIQALAPEVEQMKDDVFALGVLFQGISQEPPTAAVARDYNASIGAFGFVADNAQRLPTISNGSGAIPMLFVVDTRDMTLVYNAIGHREDEMMQTVRGLLAE